MCHCNQLSDKWQERNAILYFPNRLISFAYDISVFPHTFSHPYALKKFLHHLLSRFNESGIEPFHLSVSMGYTEFGTEDDAETFLMHMDEKMYEEKRKYHMRKKSAGLENKV